MAQQEIVQRPNQLLLAECVRCDDAQQPGRFFACVLYVGGQRAPMRQQFARVRQAAFSVLGELHGVGGALQQAQAQHAFQRLQTAADGWLRGAQLRGGGGQAAGFHDADKGLHQFYAVGSGGRGGHTLSV
jgi:hypothetical protein